MTTTIDASTVRCPMARCSADPGEPCKTKRRFHLERLERAEDRARLLELLPPGSTVYTVLRHVSRSGMVRDIDLYVIRDDEPLMLTAMVRKVLGYPWPPGGACKPGLRVSGCGMDMGFHLVHSLSCALHGHVAPPSAEAAHREGRPVAPTPECWRPGYSLQHRWL